MLKKRYWFPFSFSIILLHPCAFGFIPVVDDFAPPTICEVGLIGGLFRLAPDLRSYATQKSQPAPAFDTSVLKVNPNFRFGGGIDVIYGSSYKFYASYFETHNRKTQTNGSTVGVAFTPPVWAMSNANFVASTLDSKYRFATLGATGSFTLNCFTLTAMGGFSYLYLKHNQNILYSGLTAANTNVNLNSYFWGLGPTFAVQFGYEFCGGFSALAGLQYTPLLGDIKGLYSANTSAAVAPANNNLSLKYKTQSMLLNHVQTELGFGYIVPVNKCITGNFSLVYRLVKMVGGRETNLFVDDVSNSALNNQISNSTFHGPLLRVAIKYKFASNGSNGKTGK